ncbi:MAG: redoxin family protein [Pseudomonadota bacterium]|nr:redoxin family protein [Pseudomonadota bacterium]
MLLLLALACLPVDAPKDTEDTVGADDTGAVDTDDTGDTDTDTDETGDPGPSCAEEPLPPETRDTGDAPRVAATLAGTITWQLQFDADAEAAGYVDCEYTRVYASQVEVGDQGYLCPECTLITTGTSVMTDGYEDCFLQISSADADRIEHLGLGDVDGATHAFRSGSENVSLGDVGAIVGDSTFALAWEDESPLDDGGNMILSAAGELTVGASADVMLADVTGARTEPYACGWPQNSPGGPNPSWTVADGEIFPNVRLDDQCGDPVDLWDFRGHYLVVDSSSPDCGPCQAMAEGAEAFKARMEAECAPVELITLLNESLGAINKPAAPDVLQAWADQFGLSSPVLADKGAGYALFPEYLGIESGMSYPAVILVDPDGAVLYGSTGFGDWSELEDVLLADWATRSE